MKKQGLRLMAVLMVAGAAPLAQAASILALPPTHMAFVPATLTPTQNVRLTLVNLTNAPKPGRNTSPPDPCEAQVSFFDGKGEQVGDSQDLTLGAGDAALLPAVRPAGDGSVDVAPLRSVRATLQFPPGPCRNLQVGFEVYDVRSGGTLFMNPGVIRGFNPQPDPPGFQ